MHLISELKKRYFLSAILYMLLGAILMFFPAITAAAIAYCLAVVLLLTGISFIVVYFTKELLGSLDRYELVIGLLACICAVFIFIKVDIVLAILPFLLGLFVLVSGLIKLQHGVDLLRAKLQGYLVLFILSLISILFGILIILNPFETAATLIMIIGAGLLISGMTDIFSGLYFIKRARDFKKLEEQREDI